MKKNLSILSVLLMTLFLCSCDLSIKKDVEKAEKVCPVNTIEIGKISNISYEKGVVKFTFLEDGSLYEEGEESSLVAIDKDTELLNKMVLTDLFTTKNTVLNQLLDNHDFEIEYTLVSYDNKKRIEGKIQEEAFKTYKENIKSSPNFLKKNLLEVDAESSNESTPRIPLDDGMTITKITIDGDYEVMNIEIDENMYDMNLIQQNGEELFNELSKAMLQDSSVREALRPLVNWGIGFKWRCYGNQTKKTADFVICKPYENLSKYKEQEES